MDGNITMETTMQVQTQLSLTHDRKLLLYPTPKGFAFFQRVSIRVSASISRKEGERERKKKLFLLDVVVHSAKENINPLGRLAADWLGNGRYARPPPPPPPLHRTPLSRSLSLLFPPTGTITSTHTHPKLRLPSYRNHFRKRREKKKTNQKRIDREMEHRSTHLNHTRNQRANNK